MVQRPTTSGASARYTVTRLLEPEAPRRRRSLPWTRGAIALAILLLTGISTALPGGAIVEAAPEAAPAAPERVSMTEGEWLTLVGSGPVVEPLEPGWSLKPMAGPVLPASLEPLAGPTWRTPEPLRDILDTSARAAALARLAEAGGETQLLSRYAPPWLWASMDLPEAPQVRLPVTLPPALDGMSHSHGPAAWVDGISYYDPVGVGLPLLRVQGYESFPVSAHFTVADFATRDGAPYARIAPDLVSGLEGMRALLGPLRVISGYRHPRYNALATVGGARYSRHQTGQAADVWSPTRSSLEIAMAAVQAVGCGVGLGLGRNTVHVDVRGYLKTWVYPGAPLSDGAFHRWILGLCGGDAPAPPPLESRTYDATWLAMVDGATEDGEETFHLGEDVSDAALPEEATEVVEEIPEARPAMSLVVQRDLAAYAAAAQASAGTGVVVVDLRDGAYVTGEALLARSRFISAASPEALALDLRPLLDGVGRRPPGSLFVYALRLPEGRVETGVASTAPTRRVRPAPSAPPEAAEPQPAAPDERWIVRISSRTSLAGAEADLARYAATLADVGLRPTLNIARLGEDIVYEVVLGPFSSSAAASDARTQADALLPVPSRLQRLD